MTVMRMQMYKENNEQNIKFVLYDYNNSISNFNKLFDIDQYFSFRPFDIILY